MLINKIAIWLLAIFSTLSGLYPVLYFIMDRKFGLLESKSETLLSSIPWNIGFYIHITLGGIALLIGWTQFMTKWRNRHLKWHRTIGKVYVSTALVSSIAGIYIALNATGGLVPSLGFIGLGLTWFWTTLKAYLNIRKGKKDAHQVMMIYSYATCLGAVTLRIYLPILIAVLHEFNSAYSIVAWVSWIPNLFIAYFLLVRPLKYKQESTP